MDSLIGQNVRRIRCERNLDIAILSRSVGVAPSSLINMELGNTRIRAQTLFALAEVLGVRISAFFEDVPRDDQTHAARLRGVLSLMSKTP